jgi:ribose transport system substrate-binding protein
MSGTGKASRRFGAAAVVALSIVGVAACGSSSDDPPSNASTSGGTSSAASDANAIPAATEKLQQLMVRPPTIPVTTPVGKQVPTGKTIDWLACGSPDCTILTGPLKDAAAALGWKIHTINAGLTPETVQAAWNLAVQDHPDGVLATGFPSVMFSSALAKLKAANIPVSDGFVTDNPGNGLTTVVAGGNGTFETTGKALADATVGLGGKKTNVLFVGGSTFPGLDAVQNAFESELKSLCSDCGFGALNLPASAIGTTLASSVVAYLTKHPDVNYVVTGQGSMNIGLPQAIKSAHMTAKVVGTYPSQTTLGYLKNNEMAAMVVFPQGDAMWQMMDGLVRAFAGVSVEPTNQGEGAAWVITPENAGELTGPGPYYQVADYAAQYKKLWGVD